MFEREKTTITLSGKELPIRCDLFVLEQIQEKYKDLSDFEYKLIGFIPERDEFGDVVTNDNGNTVGRFKTPDIQVVCDALVMMVTEGIEFEGRDEIYDAKDLKRMVDIPLGELANVLHDEYMSCFKRKNQ